MSERASGRAWVVALLVAFSCSLCQIWSYPARSDGLSLTGLVDIGSIVADCDRLAADPVDAKRPRGVQGVTLKKIHAESAISACRSALRLDSGKVRLEFEMGRALQAGDQFSDALKSYRKAADAGYAAAMAAVGYMYENGIGVDQDSSAAYDWYRRAVHAGQAEAKVDLERVEQSRREHVLLGGSGFLTLAPDERMKPEASHTAIVDKPDPEDAERLEAPPPITPSGCTRFPSLC